MEPDDFGGLAVLDMALDGVAHIAAKLLQRFGFRKDGLESARFLLKQRLAW
jgi:hypothetical protein